MKWHYFVGDLNSQLLGQQPNRRGGRVTGRVGSGMGRVGSDNWLLKSGRVQTLVGRVGSEKLDPGTTLPYMYNCTCKYAYRYYVLLYALISSGRRIG